MSGQHSRQSRGQHLCWDSKFIVPVKIIRSLFPATFDLIENIVSKPHLVHSIIDRGKSCLTEAFPLTRHQNNSCLTATLELNRFEQAALPPV